VLDTVDSGHEFVLTSSRASSTGYPFKVASIPGTLSNREVYAARTRVCDLGYLREAYVKPGGAIGYRCAAEPIADYVATGGDAAATVDRMCLCNGLTATVGLGQVRGVSVEPPVITSGDGLGTVRAVLNDRDGYSAADVVPTSCVTSGSRSGRDGLPPQSMRLRVPVMSRAPVKVHRVDGHEPVGRVFRLFSPSRIGTRSRYSPEAASSSIVSLLTVCRGRRAVLSGALF